jgi:hypothetical protein
MQPTQWVRLGANQGAARNTNAIPVRKRNSLFRSLGKKNIPKSVLQRLQWHAMRLYEIR